VSMQSWALTILVGITLCVLLSGCAAVKEELGLLPPPGEEGAATEEEEWGELETEEAAVSYANDVQPIFEANCTRCHGRRRQEKKLNLTSYPTLVSRNVVSPGDAEGSSLYQKITLPGSGRMPLQGDPLSQQDIDKIKKWINAGATDN